ncbi:hypothetical protein MPH_07668 [Macrophomina phaseolina MS6]|uniref:Uncharacterized protein n=1 Tax=Macrophomina phaseolina (strain MS6) TaxID=1126212 RepID=K2RQV8_MACPH|nr:hypothetical protein MPH_07668 [Macrophomina phaseolina MS6]
MDWADSIEKAEPQSRVEGCDVARPGHLGRAENTNSRKARCTLWRGRNLFQNHYMILNQRPLHPSLLPRYRSRLQISPRCRTRPEPFDKRIFGKAEALSVAALLTAESWK